ncbi:hypothetical protein GTO89_09680 [Heliobacterium gestii]|uniref:BIG2 domain-containing protein n=1 Tax=Heliomicrobium gestii TaxID=2699 RepID=A0A845LAS9_HELGE|nr:carboxypeptidase regulatory-like domain-containing protein [Heliomicrobium gestii]MBM7867880.1 uncharacterized protein YjdB [Heliomicrobium gestii]MZP43308.1 hypothetical protein [Heliomicrobium gestii]
MRYWKKLLSLITLCAFSMATVTAMSPAWAASGVRYYGPSEDANNGNWRDKYVVKEKTPEADYMFRVGDIDNFATGWDQGFDPFSGEKTANAHTFPPRSQPADEPTGFDVVMIGSKAKTKPVLRPNLDAEEHKGYDGYSGMTATIKKAGNNYTVVSQGTPTAMTAVPITIDFSQYKDVIYKQGIDRALLQLYLDDFQATRFGTKYKVWINNQRAYFMEPAINSLAQSGPRGQLVTIPIPEEFQPLLLSGRLTLKFDDDETGYPDGFAIDFAKLLIGVKKTASTGAIRGKVKDKENGGNLEGATVEIPGLMSTTSDRNGDYLLNNVPAGLAFVTASKPGYESLTQNIDVRAGKTVELHFPLHYGGDVTAPSGTIAINGGAESTGSPAVSLTLSATDPGPRGTGVQQMRFSDDGVNWTQWEAYATTRPYTLPGSGGLKWVYVQFKDGANNVSDTAAASITFVPQVSSVAFEQGSYSVAAGLKANVKVIAYFTDNSSLDVSSDRNTSYQSSDNAIATVAGGSVAGVQMGTVTVTATYGGKSATTSVTVGVPVLTGITWGSNNYTVAKGATQNVTVSAQYSDGSSRDVTQDPAISYKSNDPSIAAISGAVITAKGVGATNVTANYGGKSTICTVSVTAAAVKALTWDQPSYAVAKGDQQPFTIRALYTDGASLDVTTDPNITITAAAPEIATASGGMISGHSQGQTVLTATFGGVSQAATVRVGAPVIKDISWEGAPYTVFVSKQQPFRIIATYSDGSTADVTSEAAYESANDAVASVNPGVITGKRAGQTEIRATVSGLPKKAATVSVVEATLRQIYWDKKEYELYKNDTRLFQLKAELTDDTVIDITSDAAVTYRSDNEEVAVINKGEGKIAGVGGGVTSIVATYGEKSASANVTVQLKQNADLSKLIPGWNRDGSTVYCGELKPALKPVADSQGDNYMIDVTDWSPLLNSSTKNYNLPIILQASDPDATITVNGLPVPKDGRGENPFALTALTGGVNWLKIVVTAQDGTTTRTYTVGVLLPPALANPGNIESRSSIDINQWNN